MERMLDNAAEHDPTTPSDAALVYPERSHLVRTRASERAVARRSKRAQWREEFPYHWNADDLVTRRDTLRFLVGGTGALFVATAVLGAVGNLFTSATVTHLQAIAAEGEVPVNGYRVFNYPDQYAQGILVNLPRKGLVAYSDVCTHLSCAVLYKSDTQQFYCPCHEGYFDAYTGNVLAGPPTRPLPLIQLVTRNGTIFAVQEVAR